MIPNKTQIGKPDPAKLSETEPLPRIGPMAMLYLLLAGLTALPPDERDGARALIERVIEAQAQTQRAQREFAFHETTLTEHLDKRGALSKSESETFVVTPSTGGEYRRLVAKDGRALSPKDESKEQRKLDEHVGKQLELTQQERDAATRDKLESRAKRFRSRLEEALEVYDFAPVPDERVDGVIVRAFRFAPKPGYRGHSRSTKVLARMEGTIWIDAERDQLAKLSLTFTKDLKFLGGLFGRVSKGTSAVIVGTLLGDVWMLDDIDVSLNARLYFLKRYRRHIEIDYHDFRRYEVDTDVTLAR